MRDRMRSDRGTAPGQQSTEALRPQQSKHGMEINSAWRDFLWTLPTAKC